MFRLSVLLTECSLNTHLASSAPRATRICTRAAPKATTKATTKASQTGVVLSRLRKVLKLRCSQLAVTKSVLSVTRCLLLSGSGFAVIAVKESSGSPMGYVVHSDLPLMCYTATLRLLHRILFSLKVVCKVFHLILTLIPLSLAALLSCGPHPLLSKETVYTMLRKSLISLGPCWIKWGQWAATRADIFPPQFCTNLGRLHNYVYQHAWHDTERALISQLPEWSDTLRIDKYPLHSGTVAQIYRGVLATAGQEEVTVAVKVLHPNIRASMDVDLALLKIGAWLFECLPGMKWLAPVRAVDNFSQTMLPQLDMTVEFENLVKFRENFAGVSEVIFPVPYLATQDVLVESFEESVPISYIVETGSADTRRRVAKIGIDLFLKMVFVDNLIHGDLHPGNLMVSRHDNSKVIVLDVGMTVSLNQHQQSMLYPLFKAFALNKYTKVCEMLLEGAPTNDCQDQDLFVSEMAEIVENVAGTHIKLRELDVSNLIGQFLAMLRKHHVQLETNFSSTIMSVLILEGLGRSLDPDLDILKAAVPYLLPALIEPDSEGEKVGDFV